MQLHPLMPIAILAVALITSGIALMVFDGARQAKLLEMREGWARGLRNDLARVLARLQNIEIIAATDSKENSDYFDEMAIRFYSAQLRLRGGEGHTDGFQDVAIELAKNLESIRTMFNADKPSGANSFLSKKTAKAIHQATEETLFPAASRAMALLWKDICHAGRPYTSLHFWLGSALLALGLWLGSVLLVLSLAGAVTVAIRTLGLL